MTPRSLLESANSLMNVARSSRSRSSRSGRGSRGPRPVWPRQLLSLIVGAPAHAAEPTDTGETEASSPVIMAAMGSRSRRRGRGPRPIAFPRNRRRG